MAQLLDGWKCNNEETNIFFETNGIDVSGCINFDFIARKEVYSNDDKISMDQGFNRSN